MVVKSVALKAAYWEYSMEILPALAWGERRDDKTAARWVVQLVGEKAATRVVSMAAKRVASMVEKKVTLLVAN